MQKAKKRGNRAQQQQEKLVDTRLDTHTDPHTPPGINVHTLGFIVEIPSRALCYLVGVSYAAAAKLYFANIWSKVFFVVFFLLLSFSVFVCFFDINESARLFRACNNTKTTNQNKKTKIAQLSWASNRKPNRWTVREEQQNTRKIDWGKKMCISKTSSSSSQTVHIYTTKNSRYRCRSISTTRCCGSTNCGRKTFAFVRSFSRCSLSRSLTVLFCILTTALHVYGASI